VIIGEYSPRRSRGAYSPIITEPEANNCFSIFVFFGTEFILISLISLSVYNVHKTASRHFENFGFVIFTYRWISQLITSNLTNQLVGFVMFTCVKILTSNIPQYKIVYNLINSNSVSTTTGRQWLWHASDIGATGMVNLTKNHMNVKLTKYNILQSDHRLSMVWSTVSTMTGTH
jgi:hypothetical protein